MPPNQSKPAAVTVVNQKGERSMKRVKVVRYYAGKKPSYAGKDEDEESEYYTTDDESEAVGNEDNEDQQVAADAQPSKQHERPQPGPSSTSTIEYQAISEKQDYQKPGTSGYGPPSTTVGHSSKQPSRRESSPNYGNSSGSDSDGDDPRLRRLKEIEARANKSSNILENQLAARAGYKPRDLSSHAMSDDEEDEEEARARHRIARERTLEVVKQPVLGDHTEKQSEQREDNDYETSSYRSNREQTEDILKNLKLSGVRSREEIEAEERAEAQKRRRNSLVRAEREAEELNELRRKIEKENMKEERLESWRKDDFIDRDIDHVDTDESDSNINRAIAFDLWVERELERAVRSSDEEWDPEDEDEE